MYLVKRRSMMLKSPNLLQVSWAYAGIECQSWMGAPRPAGSNLPLTGKEHKTLEVKPLAQGYTVRRLESWGPDSQPQALFSHTGFLRCVFPLSIGALVKSVLIGIIREYLLASCCLWTSSTDMWLLLFPPITFDVQSATICLHFLVIVLPLKYELPFFSCHLYTLFLP